MNIPFKNYVEITSGVGASAAVPTRQFILRLFSDHPEISPTAILEFQKASDVGDFFGTASEEYKRAVFYFSYLSPSATSPKRISFARHSPNGNSAKIFGDTHATLTTLQAATTGSFTLVFDGVNVPVTGIDLSATASFADVASEIQTAVRAVVGANTTNATVAYDAPNARFVFDTQNVADVDIEIEATGTAPNDLATALGWVAGRVVDGSVAQTASDAFNKAENISNNFGSFLYMTTLTIVDHVEIATLNAGLNFLYMYLVEIPEANSASWSAALVGIGGTSLTLQKAGEYHGQFPASILAATNYGRPNASVNYMFRSASLTPTVTTGADADLYDSLRINYYGRTQTAGTQLSFFQRGVLCGGPTAATDMNVYANEMWLKDDAASKIMSLLLSAGRVPANESGRAKVLSVVQETIDRARVNGTISVGRTLDAIQREYVTSISDDPLAYVQVQSAGYWLGAVIEPFVVGGTTQYKVVYTLIYAKDDAIRKVEGFHNLV